MSRSKLFLIDGNSFLYRAYFAIRSLSNSKGEPTNAIYGFVAIMRKLLQDHAPDHLAICFDRKEPTFRHERYTDYKAHRKPMPDDLVEQIEPIKNFCRASRYAIFEKKGYEADDLIGTLAVKGEARGFDVVIVTGDKDALQLVNAHIKVLNPHKEGELLDSAHVKKRFCGLGPEQVVDMMALMGDASDNIPGVRGIGEKTAVKLIHEYGSIEGLYQNLERIKSKSQKALLHDHEKDARMSKELARIDTNVPVEIDWDEVKLQAPDEPRLAEFFKRYEFRSFLKELGPASSPEEEAKRNYALIDTEDAFLKVMAQLKKQKAFSLDTETTSEDPMRAELVGVSFAWTPFEAYYVPVGNPKAKSSGIPVKTVLDELKPVLESEKPEKYGQNIKYDWMVLKRAGIDLHGVTFDTMIASYMGNPLKLNHNLDDISFEHLGVRKIETAALIGKGKNQISMAEAPVEKVAEYAAEDADCVLRLVPILKKRLEENGLLELFEKVEMPLAFVLAKMEMNGVHLDLEFLKELSDRAGDEIETLTRDIYRESGEEFNINSTKQLSDILFIRLKLPIIKRTKTGYSTDVNVLEKLASSHELPRKILEYRERVKLKSTYLDALPAMVNPETGRVHTSYHQTTTATGRLSSSDPNLQNIPIKTEAGRQIRKAFIARPAKGAGRKILAADYSQVELRILAHLAGDKNLAAAFREDRDVHRFTATLLFGVEEDEVTREMRNVAKTINFSVIYGKTAYGLSQDLHIPVAEADQFIENYFKRYAAVKKYLDEQKEAARKQGYLTTFLGRRAYFPDINSKNAMARQFAERAAINAPIQGSAADLIKLAMISIQRRLEQENLQSLMIMQVHDELVFDVCETEAGAMQQLVRDGMENAYKLDVPLKVDMHYGPTWYKN